MIVFDLPGAIVPELILEAPALSRATVKSCGNLPLLVNVNVVVPGLSGLSLPNAARLSSGLVIEYSLGVTATV